MQGLDNLIRRVGGGQRAVMAIVNPTPDSFWAGSRLRSHEDMIVRRIEQIVEQGADIIDVGGYSSRPGADDVSHAEELGRVSVVIEQIRKRYPAIPVSIDTFRSSVAEAIVAEWGPCMINDISAGEADPQMAALVAAQRLPYVAMHMRGTPATMQGMTDYDDITAHVRRYFVDKLEHLRQCGIENVIIDPGFGFAKTTEQNHRLLAGLGSLASLGVPVLAGLSRKSMVYKVTGGGPEDALAGTAALNWQALVGGASILRVHDVAEAVQVVKLYEFYKAETI